MKAFLIFEGGGAKGLAHIGALKAAEQRGIEPAGVAGASAGSIVAALVAAGYTADDLYDLGKAGRGLLDVNFLELLGAERWAEFETLRQDARRRFARAG